MKKELKGQIIESISAQLGQYPNFYITDIAGLNAGQTSKLRRECFNEGVVLTVVKNTLFAHVLNGLENEDVKTLSETLVGNTAIMYTTVPAAPAKIIKKLQRDGFTKPVIKGAYVQDCVFIGEDKLDQLRITSFIPMRYRKVEKDGRHRTVLVPAVSNLLFAFSTRETIDGLRMQLSETIPFHYIWDKATSLPIVVPDKAMEDFIRVSSAVDDDIVYMSDVSPLLRSGQKVRVKAGPFAGVEGRVVRIRKAKRVMVELPGMLAVATAYIKGEWLEGIEIE